jgi:hypothetical protein
LTHHFIIGQLDVLVCDTFKEGLVGMAKAVQVFIEAWLFSER